MTRNLCGKYTQKPLDNLKKSSTDTLKIASKKNLKK